MIPIETNFETNAETVIAKPISPPVIPSIKPPIKSFLGHYSHHFFQTPCQFLKGLGPHYAGILKDHGIETFWDLLCALPTHYTTYATTPKTQDHQVPLNGSLQTPVQLYLRCLREMGQRPWRYMCAVENTVKNTAESISKPAGPASTQHIQLVFFQKPAFPMPPGSLWWARGSIKGNLQTPEKPRHRGQSSGHQMSQPIPQMIHPTLRKNPFDAPASLAPTNPLEGEFPTQPHPVIQPHYTFEKVIPLGKIQNWLRLIFQKWPTRDGLNAITFPPSLLPTTNTAQHNPFTTLSIKEALWMGHFPATEKDTDPDHLWRQVLAYHELVVGHVALMAAKRQLRAYPIPHAPMDVEPNSSLVKQVLDGFSHDLTPSQATAWNAIQNSLAKSTPMMHLLQGDVGSGKTIVAFLALAQVAQCGFQACLVAPTETLIRQHFQALSSWVPTKLVLSGGKVLGDPQALIILGTHSLFYEKGQSHIDNEKLALVITDEQQRFGLLQRLSLVGKNDGTSRIPSCIPHMLSLSATPIPRTFQRMMSNDMDWSIIEKRPQQCQVTNHVLSKNRLLELGPWIRHRLDQGQGVYWVCSAIEDEGGDGDEDEGGEGKKEREDHKGAQARYAYWQKHFPQHVLLLHGRMSSKQKEETLQQFRQGEKLFLISTTVIEVGIHVDHACGMIIEDAERFGLAQLHQLRGRIGRSGLPGACFFLYSLPLSPWARQRLDLMRSCDDGFAIAEKDWLWRGGGDLLGHRQSGQVKARFINDFIPDAVYAGAKENADRWQNFFSHHFSHNAPSLAPDCQKIPPIPNNIPNAMTLAFQLFGYTALDGLHGG